MRRFVSYAKVTSGLVAPLSNLVSSFLFIKVRHLIRVTINENLKSLGYFKGNSRETLGEFRNWPEITHIVFALVSPIWC